MFEAPIDNLCPQSISPSFSLVIELSDFTGSIADQVMTKFLRLSWLDRTIWLSSGQWNVTDVICATSTECPVNEEACLSFSPLSCLLDADMTMTVDWPPWKQRWRRHADNGGVPLLVLVYNSWAIAWERNELSNWMHVFSICCKSLACAIISIEF